MMPSGAVVTLKGRDSIQRNKLKKWAQDKSLTRPSAGCFYSESSEALEQLAWRCC